MSTAQVRFHLDTAGDAARPGTLSVHTEAEFLRHALGAQPLLVHGPVLCCWAEQFAAGRRISTETVLSPMAELQRLLPGLSVSALKSLLTIWPDVAAEPALRAALGALAGHLASGALGSTEHAAAWLLLRLDGPPERQSLLSTLGPVFADDVPAVGSWRCACVFRASVAALPELLLGWIGIEKTAEPWPVPFPLALTEQARSLARECIDRQVAEHGAEVFTRWQTQGADVEVLRLGAASVAEWLLLHLEQLTLPLVLRLKDFLPVDIAQKLQARLPVRLPAPLPDEAGAWHGWMQREYLPYRSSPAADQTLLLPLLREFAGQFLKVYARALNGGPHADLLVWKRCADLRGSSYLTLIAICDGLSLTDLETLQRHLAQRDRSQRLTDLGGTIAFSALPTITSQAKPTLERGIARAFSDHAAPLGFMNTSEEKVRAALLQGEAGKVVFWNILRTDKLYHDAETLDQARTTANATLMALAERMVGLMLAIPDGIPAQLVITTDHGRLLLESRRTAAPPAGFAPEGRAALGYWEDIPAKGYEVLDGYALLARSTFGMAQDAAVLWDNQTFHTATGATGQVVCPHGGLSPEEVLIPWVVYARDLAFRLPTLEVGGSGEAEQPGALTVRAINPNPLPLTVTNWGGSLAALLPVGAEWTLPANSVAERSFPLARWPTSQEVASLGLRLTVQAGQGAPQAVDAQVLLQVEELYTPTDNILDDL